VLESLIRWHPSQGLMDQTFHSFVTESSAHIGAAVDAHEAERIEWVPTTEVARMIDAGEIVDGFTVVSLLAWLRRRGA
jgi:hypothetical protein